MNEKQTSKTGRASRASPNDASGSTKLSSLLVRQIVLFCNEDKHKSAEKLMTVSGQAALFPHRSCNGKSDALASVPPRSSPLADTFSSMNTPLHKLKIKVQLPITVCLLLSWLAIALVLTGLSGDLREFQWLLLAVLSGALSQAIAIIFGGIVSWPMMANDSKLNHGHQKSSTEQQR